ncbi:MAG: hypothetical protein AB7G93_23180 [Bdellovibrionales bacterium]
MNSRLLILVIVCCLGVEARGDSAQHRRLANGRIESFLKCGERRSRAERRKCMEGQLFPPIHEDILLEYESVYPAIVRPLKLFTCSADALGRIPRFEKYRSDFTYCFHANLNGPKIGIVQFKRLPEAVLISNLMVLI